MDFTIIFDNAASLAGFIGSVTVIGSALIWVYKKLVAGPKEKRDAERNRRENERLRGTIAEIVEPQKQTLEQLKINQRKQDERDLTLQQIADENVKLLKAHSEKFNEHDRRILVLEVINGVVKVKETEDDEKQNV